MKLKKTLLHGFGFLCLTCFASAQDATKEAPPEKPAPPPAKPEAPPSRPQGGPPADAANRLAEFIKRADTDSDGKISKEEFANMGKRESEDRFSKMDGNSDGFVDQTEIANIAQNIRRGPDGQGMRRPGGEGGPPGGESGFRRPPGDGAPKGEGSRPDGQRGPRPDGQGGPRPDGQGSPGMRPGGPGGEGGQRGGGMFGDPKENFKRMDADANGNISEDEYIKAMERMREMMRNRGGSPGQPGQGGARRPGGEGGPPGGGDGGFRRPPIEGDKPKEGDAPKPPADKPKDAA